MHYGVQFYTYTEKKKKTAIIAVDPKANSA